MAKLPVAVTEVEKYPDGTPIVRYPKWIYPGNKPVLASDRKGHAGAVLVNDKKEHDEYVKDHPEYADEVEEAAWGKK